MTSIVIDDRKYARKITVNECKCNIFKDIHLYITDIDNFMSGVDDYDLYYNTLTDKFLFRNSVIHNVDDFIKLLESYDIEFNIDASVIDALNKTILLKYYTVMDGHCIYLV